MEELQQEMEILREEADILKEEKEEFKEKSKLLAEEKSILREEREKAVAELELLKHEKIQAENEVYNLKEEMVLMQVNSSASNSDEQSTKKINELEDKVDTLTTEKAVVEEENLVRIVVFNFLVDLMVFLKCSFVFVCFLLLLLLLSNLKKRFLDCEN